MATDLERLVEVEERSKSNKHRIDTLENNYEALREIASSIKVLAVKQESIAKNVDVLSSKVNDLDKVPSDRWNLIINTLLTAGMGALAGAIVAAILR